MTKVCEICGKEFTVTNRNQGKKICSLACRTQKHRMATIRSDIKTALKELGLEAHGNQIASHYAHAKEKHPYFCDKFTDLSAQTWRFRDEQIRRSIKNCINSGTGVPAEHVIMSEFVEAFSAIANGNMSNAVEELYDTIAVCLRTIDVLEGRQKLGKPETKGAK